MSDRQDNEIGRDRAQRERGRLGRNGARTGSQQNNRGRNTLATHPRFKEQGGREVGRCQNPDQGEPTDQVPSPPIIGKCAVRVREAPAIIAASKDEPVFGDAESVRGSVRQHHKKRGNSTSPIAQELIIHEL